MEHEARIALTKQELKRIDRSISNYEKKLKQLYDKKKAAEDWLKMLEGSENCMSKETDSPAPDQFTIYDFLGDNEVDKNE